MSRKWSIFKTLSLICTINFSYDLNHMHAWGAVDLRIYLAKKSHGYSISAQSYDFCPHLRKLDILDFTMSHTHCIYRSINRKFIVSFNYFKLNLFQDIIFCCFFSYFLHKYYKVNSYLIIHDKKKSIRHGNICLSFCS